MRSDWIKLDQVKPEVKPWKTKITVPMAKLNSILDPTEEVIGEGKSEVQRDSDIEKQF